MPFSINTCAGIEIDIQLAKFILESTRKDQVFKSLHIQKHENHAIESLAFKVIKMYHRRGQCCLESDSTN